MACVSVFSSSLSISSYRFRATFTLSPSLPYDQQPDPRALLERRLASLSARNHEEMTHVSVLKCTALVIIK